MDPGAVPGITVTPVASEGEIFILVAAELPTLGFKLDFGPRGRRGGRPGFTLTCGQCPVEAAVPHLRTGGLPWAMEVQFYCRGCGQPWPSEPVALQASSRSLLSRLEAAMERNSALGPLEAALVASELEQAMECLLEDFLQQKGPQDG